MRPLPPNPRFRQLLLLALTACAGKAAPSDAGDEAPTEAAQEAPVDEQALGEDVPGTPPEPADLPAPGEADGSAKYTACTPDQYVPGQGATPAEAVDGLAVRTRFDGGRGGMEPQLVAAMELCGAAGDKAACETAASETEAGQIRQQGTQMGMMVQDLVWSRGDEVGSIKSVEELVGWLGPLESAGDVRLLAWAAGYEVACDSEPVRKEGGWLVPATKRVSDCPITTNAYNLRVGSDGAVTVAQEFEGTPGQACIGRLPPGLDAVAEGPGLGGWLATVAHLEAAAVHAFDQLIRELTHHGAPVALVEAARHARADEVRHAALFAELAEAAGAVVPAVDAAPVPVRSLVDIACDNAREGLVRERYGAAVGLWQARHAATPELRAAFAEVALDEVRHAELSEALDAWLRSRLDRADRARVDLVLAEARVQLAPQAPRDPQVARLVGLPEVDIARRLFAATTAPEPPPEARAQV